MLQSSSLPVKKIKLTDLGPRKIRLSDLDKYDPSQPRDDQGQFSETGGGGSSAPRGRSLGRDTKAYKQVMTDSLSSKLDSKERTAINDYTGDSTMGYKNISNMLRQDGSAIDPVMRPLVRRNISRLDSAFGKVSLSEDLAGERFVSDRMMKQLESHVGGTFSDKGYVSVTGHTGSSGKDFETRPGVTNRVRVVMPKGSKALPIKTMSHMKNENEILINRGSNFKVGRDPDGTVVLTLQN